MDGQRHGRTTRKHIASAGAYRRRRLKNRTNHQCQNAFNFGFIVINPIRTRQCTVVAHPQPNFWESHFIAPSPRPFYRLHGLSLSTFGFSGSLFSLLLFSSSYLQFYRSSTLAVNFEQTLKIAHRYVYLTTLIPALFIT